MMIALWLLLDCVTVVAVILVGGFFTVDKGYMYVSFVMSSTSCVGTQFMSKYVFLKVLEHKYYLWAYGLSYDSHGQHWRYLSQQKQIQQCLQK